METLYDKLVEVEELAKHFVIYKSLDQIDVPKTQREIFREYEANPVLNDAVSGKQTITQGLEELAKVNKGIKRFLPHKKDEAQNEKVRQMEELVSGIDDLRTRGIFYPDNAVAGAIEMAGIVFGFTYLFKKLFGISNSELGVRVITMLSPIIASLGGLALDRSDYLPKDEAKYLDEKVGELYGKIISQR